MQRLIWLCKNCVDCEKETRRDGTPSDDSLAEKLEIFGKQLTENQNSAELLQQKMEQKMEQKILEQFLETKTKFDKKINSTIENQEKMPTEIKKAWSQALPKQLANGKKKISKKTNAERRQKRRYAKAAEQPGSIQCTR